MGTEQDGTPYGPKLNSMMVDPRDAKHLLFGMSGGGVHESRDAGETWQCRDQGLPAEQAWWTVKRQAMTADTQPERAAAEPAVLRQRAGGCRTCRTR